jgi:hypothetical protein
VFTNGDSDGTQFEERVAVPQAQQSVPPAVQRLAVPHDTTARDGDHAPGTWHTLAEGLSQSEAVDRIQDVQT